MSIFLNNITIQPLSGDTNALTAIGNGSFSNNLTIGDIDPTYRLNISGSTGSLFYDADTIRNEFRQSEMIIRTIPEGNAHLGVAQQGGELSPIISLFIRGENTSNDAENRRFGSLRDGGIGAGSHVNNFNIYNTSSTASTANIRFYAGSGQVLTASTPTMHLQGSGETKGFVGINNDSPLATLDVKSLGSTSSDNAFRVLSTTGDTSLFRVRGDGAVFVESPSIPSAELLQRWKITDSESYVQIQNSTGQDGLFVPGIYGIQEPGSTNVTLTSVGQIGVDTGSTPAMSWQVRNKFQVAIGTRPLYRWGNHTTPVMQIEANGNVGIGTTTPSEKLDVSGNTIISGTLNIGTIGGGTPVGNLGFDSNGNVVTGKTGPDSITFEIFNTSPTSPDPYTIYDDGNIRLLFDEAATDDIEIVVLTNPSTGPVHVVWSEPTAGTSGSANVTTASGQIPLNTEVSADDVVDFVIWAPQDSSYPYYEAKVTVSNGTFTSIPAIARVSKWNTPS